MSLYGEVELVGKPDLENVRKLDLLPIPAIRKMQRHGIAIDRERLWDLSSDLGRQLIELEKDIASYIPVERLHDFTERSISIEEESGSPTLNANSADQIRQLLFETLNLGGKKELKRTNTGKLKTDKKNLAAIENEHPVVRKVQEYRERSKLKTTYCDGLPAKAVFHSRSECCSVCGLKHKVDTWRIHTELVTTRTDTGRLACSAWWTPITTRRGVMSIKDVVAGDYVWTHRRRWRRVSATWRKGLQPMVSVRFSNGHTLTCTIYHKLLIYSHERVQEMDFEQEEQASGIGAIQIRGMPHYRGYSRETGNHVSECSLGMSALYTSGRVQGSDGGTLLALEDGREEPPLRQVRRTTSQLERGSGRWVRIFDVLKGWEAAVPTSPRNGGRAGGEDDTRAVRCAPYRREPQEQRLGQPSSADSKGPLPYSLPTGEGQSFCTIEAIHFAGSFEVYDISVEEDESYEACGVFSHNSRNPNLQNIPIRTALGAQIRSAFIASPGTKLVSVDFGQIELVDLAHLANCSGMIEVYARSGDLHLHTATVCFDKPASEIDKIAERLPCKTTNFAVVYGITPKALSAQLAYFFSLALMEGKLTQAKYTELTLRWTEDACRDFIENQWFGLYPEVREYMDLQTYRARRYGFVWDPFGRVRRVPEIYSAHSYIRSAGIRQAGNMPIQSCSAGQLRLAIAETDVELGALDGIWTWPLLTIHDQLIVEAVDNCADDIGDLIAHVFTNVMRGLWRLPITADKEVTERWQKVA